jgi:outer membrane protein
MKFLQGFIAGMLVLCAAQAVAQSPKVGFVNGARLEKESALMLQAVEEIKKELGPREQQLQALQKQGVELQTQLEKEGEKMAPAERQTKEKNLAAIAQQFEQLRRSMAEDLEVLRREKMSKALEQVNAVIKGIADAGKYDLIVQEAVYTNSALDITDQVLKEIARRAGR